MKESLVVIKDHLVVIVGLDPNSEALVQGQ